MEHLWPESGLWLVKAAVLGAALAIDGQAAVQAVASQPLAVGVLAGWMLGDAWLGLVVGAYLQLICAYGQPRGRGAGPDIASGAIAAVIAARAFQPQAAHGYGHLALGILVGLGVSRLGVVSESARRAVNRALSAGALRDLRKGDSRALGVALAAGVAVAGLRGGLTAAVGSGLGLVGGALVIKLLAGMDFGAAFALIPCLGLGSFIVGVMKAKRIELSGFAIGLAAALLIGLEFGLP